MTARCAHQLFPTTCQSPHLNIALPSVRTLTASKLLRSCSSTRPNSELSFLGSGVARTAGDHPSLGRGVCEKRGEGTRGRENGGGKGKVGQTTVEDHLRGPPCTFGCVLLYSKYVASWPSFVLSLLWSILRTYMFGLPTVGGPIKTSPNWPVRLELTRPTLEDTGFCTSFSRHLPAVPRTRFLLYTFYPVPCWHRLLVLPHSIPVRCFWS